MSLIRGVTINLLVVSYRLFFIIGFLVRLFFKFSYKAFKFITVNSEVLFFFFIYFKYFLKYFFNNFFYFFAKININLS